MLEETKKTSQGRIVFQSCSTRSYLTAINEQEAYEIAHAVMIRYGSDFYKFLSEAIDMYEDSEKSRLANPQNWEKLRERLNRAFKKLGASDMRNLGFLSRPPQEQSFNRSVDSRLLHH